MGSFFVVAKNLEKTKKNLQKLAKSLNVKLGLKGNELIIDGEAVDEYNALNVLRAISVGFDFKTAILLANEDFMMEEIKIKDYAKPSRIRQVKARIIGSEGRALKTISILGDCSLKLYDNSVFIIGHVDSIKVVRNALISLIKGSKHSNVYASLEHKPEFNDNIELSLKDRKS